MNSKSIQWCIFMVGLKSNRIGLNDFFSNVLCVCVIYHAVLYMLRWIQVFWRWFEVGFVCSQSELTSPLNCFLFVCVLLSFHHLVCLGRTPWDWIYGYESFFPHSLQIHRPRSLSLFPSTSAGFLLLMKGSNSHNKMTGDWHHYYSLLYKCIGLQMASPEPLCRFLVF